MFKNILVPTDGSEYSRDTVRRAVAFAKEIGASITAFYAQPIRVTPFYIEGIGTHKPLPMATELEELDQRASEEIFAGVEELCAAAAVPCTCSSVKSNVVYQAIIDVAQAYGCDLIFMASHGHSGFAAVLLGSETIKVLTHSKIPVLVCR